MTLMVQTHFYFQPVEKMPIVKPETTELNVHALQISWEILTLDVTQNVLDMMIARTTRFPNLSTIRNFPLLKHSCFSGMREIQV